MCMLYEFESADENDDGVYNNDDVEDENCDDNNNKDSKTLLHVTRLNSQCIRLC